MHLMITGAAGMIGRRLTQQIVRAGGINGVAVEQLTLVDIAPATIPPDYTGTTHIETADLADTQAAERLVSLRPDTIIHLAAIVSGEAEEDFEKGYRINLDGTRALFEAIRLAGDGYQPRVVFASSIAVFGAPFPERIGDEFFLTPLTSYGTQKAICELLLADYSRRGFFDGIGIRLPTICIRPGKPNKAASGFFSNILREPLNGQEAILPVSEDVRHWFASPRAAVGFLLHAASMDLSQLGNRRNLSMPGVSATVGEEIEALRAAAGDSAAALVRHEPDATVKAIVAGWPRNFDTTRAEALGFEAEQSIGDIINAHVEDELGGKIPG